MQHTSTQLQVSVCVCVLLIVTKCQRGRLLFAFMPTCSALFVCLVYCRRDRCFDGLSIACNMIINTINGVSLTVVLDGKCNLCA